MPVHKSLSRCHRGLYSGVALVATLLVGCEKSKPEPPPIVPVEGVVTLEGKPLKKVAVKFRPVTDYGPGYEGIGVTDDAGKFSLTCRGQAGACLGENVVTVEESEIPKELMGEAKRLDRIKYLQSLEGRPLPKKYLSLVTSPLSVNVVPDKKSYTIALFLDKETN
jgi:hypothetical protein